MKIGIKPWLLLGCALVSFWAQGQQTMQYSQYLQNAFLLNPALAGTETYRDIKGSFARQWVGLDGGPTGSFFSYQAPILPKSEDQPSAPVTLPFPGRLPQASLEAKADSAGLRFHQGYGFIMQTESDGTLRTTAGSLAYSMHIPIKKKYFLSWGGSLGLKQRSLDTRDLRLLDPYDLVYNGRSTSVLVPDASLGLSFYNRSFFLSASATQVLAPRYSFDWLQPNPPGQLVPHVYVMGGYRFRLSPSWHLLPSVLVRYVDPAPASIDYSVQVFYRDLFRAGLTYRNKESVVVLLGLVVNHTITIGYSYDATLSGLRRYSSGTHGVVLGWRFAGRNIPKSPLYFW
jgi:type IX secretion system PorP/SprF family membrane protein